MRLTFALVLLAASVGFCTEPTPPAPDKQTVLKAITLFRDDPESDIAHAAGAVILQFTERNRDVLVKVNSKIVPLANEKIPMHYRSALLVAFTASNVDSQLLRHRKGDDSYAGAKQMIDTYVHMQQKNPKLRITEVDKLVELDKQGRLKSYVASP